MLSIANTKAWHCPGLSQRDNYYQAGIEPPGTWRGQGAAELGLIGEVAKQDFYALCSGYAPRSVAKLARNAGTDKRRALWDLTFSAAKAISVWWAIADKKMRGRISDCQLRAVQRTLDYIEEEGLVGTRRGASGRDTDPCHKLVWAIHEHATSQAQEAQLHTHGLLINIGINPDGEPRTLDPIECFNQKMLLGAIYRAELSRNLQQEFGVEIRRLPKGMFDIEGVPEGLKASHSTRRKQIIDAMEMAGAQSGKATRILALKTRKTVEYKSRVDLFAEWKERGKRYGFDTSKVIGQQTFRPPTHEQTKETLHGILTKEKGCFTRTSVLEKLLIEAQYSGDGFSQCRDVSEEYFKEEAVYLRMESGQRLYAIPEIAECEKRMLTQVIQGQDREFPALQQTSRVNFSGLSEDDKRTLIYLTDAWGSVKIMGRTATSNKASILRSSHEVWQDFGYTVRGIAPTADTADQLEAETGIKSRMINELIHPINISGTDNSPDLDNKTILVLDAASAVETVQLAGLVEEVEKSGARLVLVNGNRQLQPIGLGAPFKLLKRLIEPKMSNISAKHPENPTPALPPDQSNRDVENLSRYRKRGWLNITEKRPDAMRQLVDAFSRNPAEYKDKMMIASTRKIVDELNRLEQRSRIERGELGAESIHANGYDFHVGDRILFRKNDRRLQVLNGDRATVRGIDRRSQAIIARMDGGELRIIPLSRCEKIQLAYACTSDTLLARPPKSTYIMAGTSTPDTDLSYIQMLMGKENTHIYAATDDVGHTLETIARIHQNIQIDEEQLAQESSPTSEQNLS